MLNPQFWIHVIERAVKTAAQSAAAVIVATGITSAWDIDWYMVAGVSALSALLSVLTSIGSGVNNGDPSLAAPINAEVSYAELADNVVPVDPAVEGSAGYPE